jgi:LysR family transcriptional regulator, transcriptional activator of the cysJI operon
MNIESLRVFYKTIYFSSISTAARELYISQPATSLQIKSLEKELNTKLLERSNKGVLPTQTGEIVYRYAESILELYENMISDIASCDGSKVNRLTISCCSTLGEYSLPCSIYEFKNKHQEVEIHTEHTFSYDVITQIRDRGVDVGFIEGGCGEDNIECLPVGNSEMFFVASPKLVKEKHMSKEQLLKYNILIIHRKSALRKIIEQGLYNAGISSCNLKINMESPSIESIKSSVISGQGISILPYLSIKKELYNKSLSTFQVDDVRFSYGFSMIYNNKIEKAIKTQFIKYMKLEGKDKLC